MTEQQELALARALDYVLRHTPWDEGKDEAYRGLRVEFPQLDYEQINRAKERAADNLREYLLTVEQARAIVEAEHADIPSHPQPPSDVSAG